MEINLEPGRYVVAVSGGVDSVVLLDMLSKKAKLDLVVAHFDHGIREDSFEDKIFVEELAHRYGLEFIGQTVSLGPSASEDEARNARYKFLFHTMKEYGADAIVTAHHQDDLVETIFLNVLRGTGRRGLSPMTRTGILRPLLEYPKAKILEYAKQNNLAWREDSTNQDTKYLRNYLRLEVLPKLDENAKSSLINLSKRNNQSNQELDLIIENLLQSDGDVPRQWFVGLPHAVAKEIVGSVLRAQDISLSKKQIESLATKLKVARLNSRIDIAKNKQFVIGKKTIRIIDTSSV